MMVKICGMTRSEDVNFCDWAGADLLGFIFHPESPRNVTPAWVATQKPHTALKVGVFVRQNIPEIRAIADASGLDLLQLHGGQSVEMCQALGPQRVIRTMWPQRYTRVDEFMADIGRFAPVCRALLFDSGTSGGGHGVSLDPATLRDLDITHPWYLAGGLGPHNLETMKTCGASGFDLNSGLESRPGIKDHGKVQHAMNILRGTL